VSRAVYISKRHRQHSPLLFSLIYCSFGKAACTRLPAALRDMPRPANDEEAPRSETSAQQTSLPHTGHVTPAARGVTHQRARPDARYAMKVINQMPNRTTTRAVHLRNASGSSARVHEPAARRPAPSRCKKKKRPIGWPMKKRLCPPNSAVVVQTAMLPEAPLQQPPLRPDARHPAWHAMPDFAHANRMSIDDCGSSWRASAR